MGLGKSTGFGAAGKSTGLGGCGKSMGLGRSQCLDGGSGGAGKKKKGGFVCTPEFRFCRVSYRVTKDLSENSRQRDGAESGPTDVAEDGEERVADLRCVVRG